MSISELAIRGRYASAKLWVLREAGGLASETYSYRGKTLLKASVDRMSIINVAKPARDIRELAMAFTRGEVNPVAIESREGLWFGGTLEGRGYDPVYRLSHRLSDGGKGKFDGAIIGKTRSNEPVKTLILVPPHKVSYVLKGQR